MLNPTGLTKLDSKSSKKLNKYAKKASSVYKKDFSDYKNHGSMADVCKTASKHTIRLLEQCPMDFNRT